MIVHTTRWLPRRRFVSQAQGFVTHLTESAHYDEDAQGFRRLIAHGDHWMHSRLVHEGVEQRIRVEVSLVSLMASVSAANTSCCCQRCMTPTSTLGGSTVAFPWRAGVKATRFHPVGK